MTFYTDGGCIGNPGKGAWAFCAVEDGKAIYTQSNGEKETTNNKMELSAVIAVLEYSHSLNLSAIEIHTDSQYVKNGITTWIHNWKKNGWKTAAKKSVKNQEYWTKLDALTQGINITWSWVKGHSGVEFNELCDSIVAGEMNKL